MIGAVEPAVAAASAGLVVLVVGGIGRRRIAVGPPRQVGDAAPRPTGRRVPRGARAAAGVVLAATGVVAIGWFVVAAIVAAVAVARRVVPLTRARRARRDALRQFPAGIEHLVLLVHAGLTPHLAVREACRSAPSAVRPAFEAVVHRLDRGLPLADSLIAMTEVLGPRAGSVAESFGAADRYGLPLEPMLDQLARDARGERRRLDEADARRLPVRLTFPLVTCTLPSFVLVAIAPAVIAALSSLGGSTW